MAMRALRWGAGLALACAACRDATELDPSTGRPVGAHDAAADATDAYTSPRRDARPGEPEPPDAPVPADASPPDGGGVNEEVCNACEAMRCRDVDGLDLYAACFLATDPATSGPGAGTPRSELCKAVLHCARVTGCALADPQPCYCGEGVGDLACLAGQAVGPCKPEIEIAAESANPALIAERLADPAFASGAAFNLLRYCERPICGDSCLGPPPPPPPDAAPPPPDAPPPPPDAPPPPPDAAPPPPDAPPPGPCADLDSDGIPDCDQTLVQNARFDHDTSPWTADFGALQSRDASRDALGDPSSGVLIVLNTIMAPSNGTFMTGSSQCIATAAGARYLVAAQVLIPPMQGAGAAGLNVQAFPTAGCSGAVLAAWSPPLLTAAGAWSIVSGTMTAPAGAASLRVRLVVQKPYTAPILQALFDNVLVRPQP